MKKLVGIILVVMMMVIFGNAYADAYDDLKEFVENDYRTSRWYNEDVSEFHIYREYGCLEFQKLIDYWGLDPKFAEQDPMEWFEEYYTNLGNETYPDIEMQITFGPYDEYKGMKIYRIIVIGDSDLMYWIDGIQTMYDALVVFE